MGDVILFLVWGAATLLPTTLLARRRRGGCHGEIPARDRRAGRLALAALAAALILPGLPPTGTGRAAALPPPPPTTYTVTRVDDPAPNGCSASDCSLREAVLAANVAPAQAEVIVALPAGQYRLTRPIVGTDTPQTGDLDLLRDVTIAGTSAATTAISAGGIDRVIDIGAAAVVTIRGVTLRDGNARVSGITGVGVSHDHGGAVHNHGILTLVDSTIRDSVAFGPAQPNGGGLYNALGATAILRNATVALNTAATGGGIENGGDLFVVHATVTGNEGTPGGGFRTTGAGANSVLNTIIAGNRNVGTATSPDCAGALGSPQYSLIEDLTGCDLGTGATGTIAGLSPHLGYLQSTAGYVFAYEPQPASPAIDAADPQHCPGSDQRGVARPQGPGCDIGAIEYVPAPPSCGQRFGDVPASDPACVAIEALAARGVINGCDASATPPLFCPEDPTLRHQMAALIVRAIPDWAGETGLPNFTDNTEDTELMTRVGTLQRHNVVRGYQDEVCNSQGKTPPCYGPLDTIKYGQVLLFIARAMVANNYWTLQPDDRTIFPDQNGAVGADPNTDQQTLDHRAVVTYIHYVGNPPDVADVHAPFQRSGVANGGWGDDSTRAWFARAFWPAIQSH